MAKTQKSRFQKTISMSSSQYAKLFCIFRLATEDPKAKAPYGSIPQSMPENG